MKSPRRRSGFTLTELLIVIGIILLLATMALATFGNRNSDRMRSAARVGRSAFLGTKDRAMHAKNFRGVRLIRDQNGPTFPNGIPCTVSGFVYTQPIDLQSYSGGSVQLERYDVDQNKSADSTDVMVVRGSNVNWFQLYSASPSLLPLPGQIRIPSGTGPWYPFTTQIGGNGPYVFGANNQVLQLSIPYTGPTTTGFLNGNANPNAGDVIAVSAATASCDIQLGSEVLPFHAPIPMPAGTVVDLRYSSQNLQYLAGINLSAGSTPPNVDFSFSPRGQIAGSVGGLGAFYLCLRDLEDAISPDSRSGVTPRDPSDPAVRGECLVLALNSQTGLVQTYPADLTDSNADGFVDDLFSFARAGKAAGR